MGGRAFPSYRAQDRPRGERAHLRLTTRKPNISIIIKVHKKGEIEVKEGTLKHVRANKVQNEERKYIHAHELRVGRDEAFKRCSGTRHPSSSLVMGAGRAWVSAPPVPWCRASVTTGVVPTRNFRDIFEIRSN